jgi:glycine oxidase
MNPSSSVAVVGGGVFGAVTAFELARAGRTVVLFERDPIGSHASGRNPANLNPILGTPAPLLSLALESFRLHESLHHELTAVGCGEYRIEPVRRILVWCQESEREPLVSVARDFSEQPGFAARWLDAGQVRHQEPRLAADVAGGLLLEGNRSLDAAAFNRAVVAGATNHGARVVQSDVRELDPIDSGFRLTTASGEAWTFGAVVLATGPWVEETKRWLGITAAVRPVRGQMARVELPGGPVTADVTHGKISIYRRGSSEAWLGTTHEEAGFDEQPTPEGLEWLVSTAARSLPCVREARVTEQVAALRPTTPDGLPLLGPVPGREGIFLANGGAWKGMLLCAAAGRAIRDLIVDGGTSLPVEAFAPGRSA